MNQSMHMHVCIHMRATFLSLSQFVCVCVSLSLSFALPPSLPSLTLSLCLSRCLSLSLAVSVSLYVCLFDCLPISLSFSFCLYAVVNMSVLMILTYIETRAPRHIYLSKCVCKCENNLSLQIMALGLPCSSWV